jgi:hypothetical protein
VLEGEVKRFNIWIENAMVPENHIGNLYALGVHESPVGEWVKAEDVFRSCSCEVKYGAIGGCVICNPGKLLELADRALAVCEAQHGAGDRCCLMREVADALQALAPTAADHAEGQEFHAFMYKRKTDKQAWPAIYMDRALAESMPDRVGPVVSVRLSLNGSAR